MTATDTLTAALVSLAEGSIPTDVQGLLLNGNPQRKIPPFALANAIAAALRFHDDAMERENTFLRRLRLNAGCPYGHATEEGACELGYPGCACMDDALAMTAWAPEDEERAAVRIGARLAETTRLLAGANVLLEAAARKVKSGQRDVVLAATMREYAARRVRVSA